MKVFTYHRDITGLEDPDLLNLWRESWAAAGWEPRVLGVGDAKPWPGYARFLAKAEFFCSHSVNPMGYQLACIERWMAVSRQPLLRQAPVVMADWDVINYGFTPARVFHDWVDNKREFLFYSPTEWTAPCPAVSCGLPVHFNAFAHWFLTLAESNEVSGNCHDEDLLQNGKKYPVPSHRIAEAPRPFGHEADEWRRWKRRPTLVHFANGVVLERPRSAVVRRGHPFDYSA